MRVDFDFWCAKTRFFNHQTNIKRLLWNFPDKIIKKKFHQISFHLSPGELFYLMILFMGRVSKFLKIVYFFKYTCPNRLEYVVDEFCILKVLENNLRHEILIFRPQKSAKICFSPFFKAFIGSFLYYNCYSPEGNLQ